MTARRLGPTLQSLAPVAITLPDGAVRRFPGPVTGGEIAAAIGPGLAKAAVAIKVDGRAKDLSARIDRDAKVAIVTRDNPEALEIIRHDAAHVMAEAVKELYPETQVTFGPATETGFYYDFARATPFTPEDLTRIEARMHEIVDRDETIAREEWERDAAVEFFAGLGEKYKAEWVHEIPKDEAISLYRQGKFVDLCVGPHLPSTGKLGHAFKLTKVAGAYWRGDARNAQLQRVYGTAWATEKELKQYLFQLEEAEKRDHRRLGRELDLFHQQEEAVGAVFWHPKGWTLYRTIETYIRSRLERAGYVEVRTPQLLDRSLWEASGHWEKFREHMFTIEDVGEKRVLAVKPMNCPCHVQIFRQRLHSYRELPLRMAEFGSCHRNEPSGALHGIMRVRAFTQDDAHIFCTEDQITAESIAFCDLLQSVYRDFGFKDVSVKFSDRPPTRAGSDEVWDKAEAALQGRDRGGRASLHAQPRRGRVLWAEARIRAARCLGPRLAMRDLAGRLRAARAARRLLYRRGRAASPPGHAASRHTGLDGALHRHPDRGICRALPALARARPGHGAHHHRGRERLRRGRARRVRRRRPARRNRSFQRKDQLQGPRAQSGQDPGAPRRRQARGAGNRPSRCAGLAAKIRKILRSARPSLD